MGKKGPYVQIIQLQMCPARDFPPRPLVSHEDQDLMAKSTFLGETRVNLGSIPKLGPSVPKSTAL